MATGDNENALRGNNNPVRYAAFARRSEIQIPTLSTTRRYLEGCSYPDAQLGRLL